MENSNYDNVILGSSPILLLEAIYLSISGKKVIVIEKKKRLGGAWHLLDFYNNNSVESGCHIWYRDKRVYEFFKKNLGISLIPCEPQPQIIDKNKKYHYHRKKFIKLYKGFRNNFSSPSYWLTLVRQYIEESSVVNKYAYPKRGSVELIEKLLKLIKELKIEVLSNQKLSSIKILKENITVEAYNNKKFYCDQIIASSHTELENLIVYGEPKNIENRNQNSNFSIHILIESMDTVGLSYLHILDNNKIIRVANLNFQIERSNSKENLLCIQISNKLIQKNGKTKRTVNIVLQELIRLKIIHSKYKLIKYKFSNYSCYYRNFEETKALKQDLKEKLRFINSINLIYSIRRELDRWLRLDKKNKIQSLSNK